jgi:hypothetical protein
MNRSILIVICDFLLVSLLAFSTVDINKVAEEGSKPLDKFEISTNQADASGKDLAAVMRMALDDERRDRDRLMGELARAKTSVTANEEQIRTFQKELQTSQQTNERLAREQSALQGQFVLAQTNIATLSRQLQSTSNEVSSTRDRAAAIEAELRKQTEQAAALQKQITQLQQSNQLAATEKQQLATALQVAQTEKKYATAEVAKMEEQVKAERQEKAKLAENVKTLASRSTQLAEEIRGNTPLAPNAIFQDFVTNRVAARFDAYRAGLIDTNRRRNTDTVLVTDGTNTFALCHAHDTPVNLSDQAADWDRLTGTLNRNNVELPIRSVAFYFEDPRIVLIPIDRTDAQKLGGKVYRLSSDPFKFQDAVLVGASESYYGECRFQIDLSTPEYVKLDRSVLRGLFGQFNPSRGDLVFSKNGELLGIMANNTYCLKLRDFNAVATMQFGQDVRSQRTGNTLARLYAFIVQKPSKLQ